MQHRNAAEMLGCPQPQDSLESRAERFKQNPKSFSTNSKPKAIRIVRSSGRSNPHQPRMEGSGPDQGFGDAWGV